MKVDHQIFFHDPDQPSQYETGYDTEHPILTFFLAISAFMLVVCIVAFIAYKAYKNLSSATLISIVILMWLQSSAFWALFTFRPLFFVSHLATFMDLDNLLSGYLSGLTSMVIYIQWTQVYKVISNPEQADQTLIRN